MDFHDKSNFPDRHVSVGGVLQNLHMTHLHIVTVNAVTRHNNDHLPVTPQYFEKSLCF